MFPQGSLPCSQEPATVPYPEQDVFSPHPSNLFLSDYFDAILYSTPGLHFKNFGQNFACIYPLRAACIALLIGFALQY
jgi:hypothetical protein